MKHRMRWMLALFGAAALLGACAQPEEQAAEAPAMPETAPAGATEEAQPAESAAAEGQTFEDVGVTLALPAGWSETELPEGLSDVTQMGAQGLALKEDAGLPMLVVLGFPKELSNLMVTGMQSQQKNVLDELLTSIKDSLAEETPAAGEAAGEAQQAEVLAEEAWTKGEGIAEAKRMRVKGFNVDEAVGPGVADVIAARSEGESIYLIVAVAGEEAGLDEVQPILESIELGSVTAPAAEGAAAEGAGAEGAAAEAEAAPAEGEGH